MDEQKNASIQKSGSAINFWNEFFENWLKEHKIVTNRSKEVFI